MSYANPRRIRRNVCVKEAEIMLVFSLYTRECIAKGDADGAGRYASMTWHAAKHAGEVEATRISRKVGQ